MKTLNRTLSLALVFALVFSLMSFAFAADTTATTTTTTTGYTDAASITYKEAVDVTSAIGVFQGMDANAFNPKTSLTREQAAKIITYLLMGKSNADKLTASTAPYTDVAANRWSAGCIAYCTNSHILAGYGDGTFGPTDNVTGYQFAKMLLVALGYDADVEGFTGSNWAVNVAKRGFENDLFKYNEQFNGNTAATREEASLYTCNTLRSCPVYYQSKGTTVNSNGTTIHVGATAPEHYTKSVEGTTVFKSYADMYFPNLAYTSESLDDMGRLSRTWSYKTVLIGTYPYAPVTITYNSEKTASAVTKDLKSYSVPAAGVYQYVNGYSTGKVVETAASIAALTGNGRTVELYTDGGVLYAVVVVNTVLAKVSSISTSAESVTYAVLGSDYCGSTAVKSSVGYGTFKLGDYVVLTPVQTAGNKVASVYAVAAPKVVSGIAASKSTADDTINMAGTNYTAAKNITTGFDVTNFKVSSKDNSTLLLDANGYIILAKSDAAVVDKIVAISRVSQTLTNGEVVPINVGITSDGKEVNLPASGTQSGKGTIAVYAQNASNSSLYDTTAVVNNADNLAANYFTKTATIAPSEKTATAVDGTHVFYYADSVKFIYDYSLDLGATYRTAVATGVQKVTAQQCTYILGPITATGTREIVAVFVKAAPEGTSVSTDTIVYVAGSADAGSLDKNGVTYNVYPAYVNGKALTDFYTTNTITTPGFYYITKDATSGAYTVGASTAIDPSAKIKGTQQNGIMVGMSSTASKMSVMEADSSMINVTLDANTVVVDENDGKTITSVGALAAAFLDTTKSEIVHVLYNSETNVASYVYVTSKSNTVTYSAITATAGTGAVMTGTVADNTLKIGAATAGKTISLNVTGLASGATVSAISGTPAIATVNATGNPVVVTSVANGSTVVTITITAADGFTTTTVPLTITVANIA